MGFQSAAGLWLLLALPVIVLFYLFKRKYADTPVSSHMLWNRVLKDMEANRPWQKLRSRLLMLLQLLAALLAVLAVAGLLIWRDGGTGGYTIYVLDGSASMRAPAQRTEPGSEQVYASRMEAAKASILQHAEKHGAAERSLVLLSRQPEVLLSRDSSTAHLKKALEAPEPVYGAAAYKETMTLAAAMAEGRKDARIVFVTDGQWAEDTEPLNLNVPVTVMKVSGPAAGSVGIVRFGVGTVPGSGTGGGERLYQGIATVRNWGAGDAGAEAALYAEGRLAKVEKTVLGPGEEKHWSFADLPAASWYMLEVKADPDGLDGDNIAFATPAAGGRKTVLLAGPGNLFLEKALRLAQADVILAAKTDAGYALPRTAVDLIVLDQVREDEIPSEGWRTLLGEKPVWSIRPGLKGTVVKPAAGGVQAERHPVLSYIDWGQVHISEALNPAELQGLEPVASVGGTPLLLAGGEAGKRKLVFTFRLDHSDLALRSAFPILVQNAVDWLTADSGGVLGFGTAGEPVEVNLSPKTKEARWEAAGPSGMAAGQTEPWTAASGGWSAPALPGLYRLAERDESGQAVRSRLFAAVPDVRESDLGHLPETGFLTGSPSGETEGADKDAEPVSRSPYPLTAWLAAAMIAVLLWEWEVYRRGHTV